MLPWRTLSTDLPCHLRDLLRSLLRAALPPSLHMKEGGDVGESDGRALSSNAPTVVGSSVSGATPIRLGRLIVGDLAHRVMRIARAAPEEQEVIALLGLRLTPCQWRMLHLLLAHPLLSDEELAAFLHLRRSSVRCFLYELHGLGCLEPIATTAGKRWHLCGRGLRLLASVEHIHIRNMATWPNDTEVPETANAIQRGEVGILQHMGHNAGIYGFFARLTTTAKRELGQALCWWETGPRCERCYRVHEQWYNLRPDALASYRLGQQQRRFWLEWDRGTMNVRDLSIKFSSYAHYVATREWARESARLPRLLCITPDIAQERRMHRVGQAKALTSPSALAVWTTTEVLVNEHGPLAPIWLPGMPQGNQAAQLMGSLRQCLSEVMSGKKGT